MSDNVIKGFVNHFNACNSKYIDFGYFLKQFYQNRSSDKICIKYSDFSSQSVAKLKEAIIKNLHLNPYFSQYEHKRKQFESFIKIFDETNDFLDDNLVAKLIFLIHSSKACEATIIFRRLFEKIDTFYLIDESKKHGYEMILNPLRGMVGSLLINNQIQNVCLDTIKTITKKKCIIFDFNKIQVVFFRYEEAGLRGFGGVEKIYASITAFDQLFHELPTRFGNTYKIDILKLDFIRLFIHEMAYVILRYVENDVNVSTPDLLQGEDCTLFEEAGLIAEHTFLGGRINWQQSSIDPSFNITYCREFMESIMSNKSFDFKIDLANCKVHTSSPLKIALDCDLDILEML